MYNFGRMNKFVKYFKKLLATFGNFWQLATLIESDSSKSQTPLKFLVFKRSNAHAQSSILRLSLTFPNRRSLSNFRFSNFHFRTFTFKLELQHSPRRIGSRSVFVHSLTRTVYENNQFIEQNLQISRNKSQTRQRRSFTHIERHKQTNRTISSFAYI